MNPIAEQLHEIGRRGVLEAKAVLEELLPGAVDLPFNAYDTTNVLTFDDGPAHGGPDGRFVLDLGGILRRAAPSKATGEEVSHVFVEVKTKGTGAGVLEEYKEFLRRAAIVSLQRQYETPWFVFYCTVPFGSTKGNDLVDGTLLTLCAASWPKPLQEVARDLDARVVLVIATKSFVKMLTSWGQHAS
jgi:hypothetical protein